MINVLNNGRNVVNDSIFDLILKAGERILRLLCNSEFFNLHKVHSMGGVFVTNAPSMLHRKNLCMNDKCLPIGRRLKGTSVERIELWKM
jgi:hypothetical protein